MSDMKRDPNDVILEPQDEREFARLRRNRIAEGFAFALVASGTGNPSMAPAEALHLADALIAELDK